MRVTAGPGEALMRMGPLLLLVMCALAGCANDGSPTLGKTEDGIQPTPRPISYLDTLSEYKDKPVIAKGYLLDLTYKGLPKLYEDKNREREFLLLISETQRRSALDHYVAVAGKVVEIKPPPPVPGEFPKQWYDRTVYAIRVESISDAAEPK
jgi:hypothetical protein